MAKSFSTDPRVSRNTMTIRGTLNPKQREAPVEITAAEISYSARPQATAYK
jgi:hypothetical protein